MSVYAVDKTSGDLHIVANLHAEPATNPLPTDMSRIGMIAAFGMQPLDEHWCLCDGSTVDPAVHPILATYISVFPDLRECVPVGAGENSTATIGVHDIYTVGQFKDDRMRSHIHYIGSTNASGAAGFTKQVATEGYSGNVYYNTNTAGDTTHGKQVGVLYYMYADL